MATVQSLWSEESKCRARLLTKRSAPAPWQGLSLQFRISRCAQTGSEKRRLHSFSFPNIEDIRLCIWNLLVSQFFIFLGLSPRSETEISGEKEVADLRFFFLATEEFFANYLVISLD